MPKLDLELYIQNYKGDLQKKNLSLSTTLSALTKRQVEHDSRDSS